MFAYPMDGQGSIYLPEEASRLMENRVSKYLLDFPAKELAMDHRT